MSRVKDNPIMPAVIRVIVGAAAALGLVFFVAQIPPGTIAKAASTGIASDDASTQPAPHLSIADQAACSLLHQALLRIARGMEFDRALTNYAFVPWTAGPPSASMRAVFASFHRATALQQNYINGSSSQQEAAQAFNSSVLAYSQLCEVRA